MTQTPDIPPQQPWPAPNPYLQSPADPPKTPGWATAIGVIAIVLVWFTRAKIRQQMRSWA